MKEGVGYQVSTNSLWLSKLGEPSFTGLKKSSWMIVASVKFSEFYLTGILLSIINLLKFI